MVTGMEIKDKSVLTLDGFFPADLEKHSLILVGNQSYNDKEFRGNLSKELEGVSFDTEALTESYKIRNLCSFGLLILLEMVALWVIRSPVFESFGHLGLPLSMLLMFAPCFLFLVSIKAVGGANNEMRDEELKKLKKLCLHNPKVADYVRNKISVGKPLINRDWFYLNADKQIAIIESHEKRQLMREMVYQQTGLVHPRITQQINELAFEEHKTLQWRVNSYKRRAIKAPCVYVAWLMGVFLCSLFQVPPAIIALLALGSLIGLFVVIFCWISETPSELKSEKLRLSSYEQIAMLCKMDKRNRDYVGGVLEEGRVLLQMDCDNMKMNEQLKIIESEKQKSMVAKQLGVD